MFVSNNNISNSHEFSAPQSKRKSSIEKAAQKILTKNGQGSPTLAIGKLRQSKKLVAQITILARNNKILTNGNRYVGEMKNGVPHGKGREYKLNTKTNKKEIVYKGLYENGARKEQRVISIIAQLKKRNPYLI